MFVAIPALSQEQDAPESLLPPGFGDPDSLPPPVERAPPPPPSPAGRPPTGPAPAPATPGIEETSALEEEELDALDRPGPTNYFAVPPGVARPTERVGVLSPGRFGLAANAFGQVNGAFLTSLMGDIDAPLPSRWTSILLRRLLLSRLDAPAYVHPVDFVAARAELLLRMGEADAARMLVQSVDQENFTPAMIEAAADTALANADIAGLCPLAAAANSRQTVWTLASAMCASLEGEPARAAALVDEARRQGGVSGPDILLAEKVIGAGPEARRAATIQWEEMDQLSPWRFGLASATGAEIPDRLMEAAPLSMQAWFARSPMVPLEQRLDAAAVATSIGVFSAHTLTEIYSLLLDRAQVEEIDSDIAERLRTAWADPEPGDRMAAIRALWLDDEDAHRAHARLVLTSGPASRIPVTQDHAADAGRLIASMLSAGLDREAAQWQEIIADGGDVDAWALLALGSPQGPSENRLEPFISGDSSAGKHRSQLLVAGLAGLGRLDSQEASSAASNVGFDLGRSDRWTQAIDMAAQRREPGTVILLAAAGMQTRDWTGVPPAYLFRIVRALTAVGLEYEARMIAAEALVRT